MSQDAGNAGEHAHKPSRRACCFAMQAQLNLAPALSRWYNSIKFSDDITHLTLVRH